MLNIDNTASDGLSMSLNRTDTTCYISPRPPRNKTSFRASSVLDSTLEIRDKGQITLVTRPVTCHGEKASTSVVGIREAQVWCAAPGQSAPHQRHYYHGYSQCCLLLPNNDLPLDRSDELKDFIHLIFRSVTTFRNLDHRATSRLDPVPRYC